MQRRSWLKLGALSAAVLLVAGGTAAMLQPGLRDGFLTSAGRSVFSGVGAAMLDGSLPMDGGAREIALRGLLDRMDLLVQGLPPHAQADLSLLLALLACVPGRLALAGLAGDWLNTPIQQVQRALQSMRISSISLRQQAYQALHDLVESAYFSDTSTWRQLGYPGPLQL